MIRLLIFFLSILFVVFMVTFFAGMEGVFRGEVFGQKFNMPEGLLFTLLFLMGAALILGTAVTLYFVGLPGRLRARKDRRRMDRGVAALTRGLEAVAVADPTDAQHHARIARRHLGEGSLTRLLTAQAAELSGDAETASQSFAAMLEAPETEFLGLRGLYDQAMRDQDLDAARGYAERAFRLRANADWAFQSVFDLALERGGWGEARDALDIALNNRVIDAQRGKRGQAALLAAAAYAADQSGDQTAAQEEAELALKAAPGFAPAAALVARLQVKNGRVKRAIRTLEQAFADTPDKALASVYLALDTEHDAAKKATTLRGLASKNSSSPAAAYALAQAHHLSGDVKEAIALMEPLLAETAPAQDCAFMADMMGAAYGEAAARPWLERAAMAPRDPNPGADGDYTLTRTGWAVVVREYMEHGRLAPPPLEGLARGLASEEFQLLAAPIAAIAAPIAEEAPEPAPESAMDQVTKAVSGADATVETGHDASPPVSTERVSPDPVSKGPTPGDPAPADPATPASTPMNERLANSSDTDHVAADSADATPDATSDTTPGTPPSDDAPADELTLTNDDKADDNHQRDHQTSER